LVAVSLAVGMRLHRELCAPQ